MIMSSALKSKGRARIRKIFVDMALIVGITGIIILTMEGILRLFFPQNLRGQKIIGEQFSNSDETIGYRYTPGAKWRFFHPEYKVQYEINRDGYRDRKQHPIPKPQATTRVLLIGDSFTFGQGVSYDEIWPVIVEQQLKKAGHDNIDLVKAGIQGLDTRSEFFLIPQLLEKYDCDVVVIGFLINDLYTNSLYGLERLERAPTRASDGNLSNGRMNEKKSEERWSQAMKKVFVRNSRKKTFHLLTLAKRLVLSNEAMYNRLYLAAPNRGEWLKMPLSEKPKHQIKVTETIFQKISDHCRALDKKLIVFSIPQQFQVLYYNESQNSPDIDVAFYDKHFAKFANENGFAWVASLNHFINSRFMDDELFYRLDGHLSPKGNEVAAEAFIQNVFPLFK